MIALPAGRDLACTVARTPAGLRPMAAAASCCGPAPEATAAAGDPAPPRVARDGRLVYMPGDGMDTRVIYLVRHGRIALEREQKRYVGQIDLPLDAEGQRQARALARRFEHAELAGLFCSDLSRSRDTAAAIGAAAGIAPVVRPDLREIAMGEWEGLSFREVARRFPDAYRARGDDLGGFRVPGGESFIECGRRVVSAFEEIAGSIPGNLLIVGHAGVNRLILAHLLGMPVGNVFRLGQDYACLNLIQSSAVGYQVRLVNGRARPGHR